MLHTLRPTQPANSELRLSDAFAVLKARFYGAFLSEDTALAGQICQQARQSDDLNVAETLELAEFYQLLGNHRAALEVIETIAATGTSLTACLKKAELLRLTDEDAYTLYMNELLHRYPSEACLYHDYASYLQRKHDTINLAGLLETASVHAIPDMDRYSQSMAMPQGADDATADPSESCISDSELTAFMNIIMGRENRYARQWVSGDGKSGYTTISEPPNLRVMRNHIQGIYTVGFYQLDSNNRVKWIVFDLDVAKELMHDYHDPQFRAWADEMLQGAVRALVGLLMDCGIRPLVENSGYKGYHVWLIFDEPISAMIARAFAQKIATRVDLEGMPISMEVFPKQTRLTGANLGNLVKLPYGIHQLSGKKSSFVDDNFHPIAITEFIRNPCLTTATAFVQALRQIDPEFSLSTLSQTGEAQLTYDMSAMMLTETQDPESDPEWMYLKRSCHALACLDDCISRTGFLLAEHKKALKYACGFLKNGPAIVNMLLKKCRNTELSDLMKSSFKGSSISCAKLCAYLHDIYDSSQCQCDFARLAPAYDTPLLHLANMDVSNHNSYGINEMQIKVQIEAYLRAKKDFREMQSRMNQIENELITAVTSAGIDHLDTPWGLMKINDTDGCVSIDLVLK